MAIKAVILAELRLLQALVTARRANAAAIEPVTICINAILDVIFVYEDPKVTSQRLGLLPGCDLKSYQLVIGLVRLMLKESVTCFV